VVVLWVYGYPSCVEVIVIIVWLCTLSLLCRDDCCFGFISIPRGDCVLTLCIASWVGVVVLEIVVYSQLCNCKFLGGGSLCGRSYVDVVKIILCEGKDVEQWLEPRNICWCLRLIHHLSYILHCFILHIFIC